MSAPAFTVHLTNFEGPFDLLLQLISRHKMDVTEVALSAVTDEFIGHIRARGSDWDLDQTSSFIVVAATLLDLKAARLLPQGEVEDLEDLALLEARDLLFARLLQYRAFKEVSALIAARLDTEGRRHARPGGLEEAFASLLPEVVITADPDQLAWLAARALRPKEEPAVSLAHLHAPTVSVREQAEVIVGRLRRSGTLTFRALVADAEDRNVVVARFLALLELARERAVGFEQLTALGELTVRWTGAEAGDLDISAEFDEGAEPGTETDD
ncbi:MAG: segregation and condensation protein A [Propioniciclava sp.]